MLRVHPTLEGSLTMGPLEVGRKDRHKNNVMARKRFQLNSFVPNQCPIAYAPQVVGRDSSKIRKNCNNTAAVHR